MNPQDPYQPSQQLPPAQPMTPPVAQPTAYGQPVGVPQQPTYQATPQPAAQPYQPAAQPGAVAYQPTQAMPTPVVPDPYQAQQVDPTYQTSTQFQPQTNAPDTYSIDYLNQIASTEQKTVNKFAVFGLIGGVIAIAIVAVALTAGGNGTPNPSAQLQALSQRVDTIQKVATAQQPHLKETVISEANAALGSSMSTMSTDLTSLMKERKIPRQESATLTEKSYQEALSKKLDDSYQRGTLDRTYTSQMTYELTILRSKLTTLKASSSGKAITDLSNNGIANIDLVLKAYAAFDATK